MPLRGHLLAARIEMVAGEKIIIFVVCLRDYQAPEALRMLISLPRNLICFTASLFQIIADTCQIFKFINHNYYIKKATKGKGVPF
eukprot:UN18443